MPSVKGSTGPGQNSTSAQPNPAQTAEGLTSDQRTVVSTDPSVASLSNNSLEQDKPPTTPIHGRRVSLLKTIENKFLQLVQWLKKKLLPAQISQPKESLPDGATQLKDALNSFQPDGAGIRQTKMLTDPARYLERSAFEKELQSATARFDDLKTKHEIINEFTRQVLDKMLRPDTCTVCPITPINAVKTAFEKHNIELMSVPEDQKDPNTYEMRISLDEQKLAEFKKSAPYETYQLYLSLACLRTIMTTRAGNIDDKNASQELKKFHDDVLVELVNKALGLCHATLKAEKPEYFGDTHYMPLNITDSEGASWFRSDIIQPRGGWYDTRY